MPRSLTAPLAWYLLPEGRGTRSLVDFSLSERLPTVSLCFAQMLQQRTPRRAQSEKDGQARQRQSSRGLRWVDCSDFRF